MRSASRKAAAAGQAWSVGVDATTLGGVWAGIPKYVTLLLEGVCRRYTDVHFFLYSYTTIHFPDLPNVSKRTTNGKTLLEIWRNTSLPEMVARDGPQSFWGTDGVLPLRGMRGIRTVLTVHDLAHRIVPHTQDGRQNLRRAILQRLSVHKAVRNVAVSHATSSDMFKHYGRGADHVVHPLCPPHFRRIAAEEVMSVRSALKLPRNFWLGVGTLEPRKNFVALIDAYEACLARGISLPLLVLVGGNGWMNSDILDRVQNAVDRGHVRRLGFVEEDVLPALYAACDVFFMPSLYEGFGMPIVEAQLCGTPVVHGSHGSMIEAGGGIGVAVDPDSAGIERIMEQICANEAPLACRLPTDRSIQTMNLAVAEMAAALGLPLHAAPGPA
jgi:glycosyltransferase involved in cell wall biosynthesis